MDWDKELSKLQPQTEVPGSFNEHFHPSFLMLTGLWIMKQGRPHRPESRNMKAAGVKEDEYRGWWWSLFVVFMGLGLGEGRHV